MAEKITVTAEMLAAASRRSFRSRNETTALFVEWYESANVEPLGLTLNPSEDASLRTAICRAAGIPQKREAVLNEDGSQKLSEKRGKPQFKTTPYTSDEMLGAMDTLGIVQYDLAKSDESRTIAIVRTSEEIVPLADTEDEADEDEDEN